MKRKFILICGLTLFGLFLFAFLTLAGMPVDRILASRLYKASDGGLALTSDHMGLRFPDRIIMKGVAFRFTQGNISVEGRLDALEMRPEYRRITKGYVPVLFEGKTPAGSFQGSAGVSIREGMKNGFASLSAAGLSLEMFPFVKSLMDREIKGLLSVDVDMDGDLRGLFDARGKGNLLVENGAIEARLGIPGLEQIPFDTLEISFYLEDGILHISRAEMKGPAFSGYFKGDIELHQEFQRSWVSLEGDLTPGRLVLDNAFLGGLLGRVLEGGESVSVSVNGPPGSPAITRIMD